MSRLNDLDLGDDRTQALPEVLRRPIVRRGAVRVTRHPEKTHDLLRARAKGDDLRVTHWRYERGWILKLWGPKGLTVREYGRSVSYEEAALRRDEELESGDFESAWLERRED